MTVQETITGSLPVMEHFYTLQGEGFHQGRAAYFIRLGGCDVGCVWCDVKESWDTNAHPRVRIDEILQFILSGTQLYVQDNHSKTKPFVVVTGGEPLMHNLDELTAAIRTAGYPAHIETSGAHPLSGRWDWICVSPKKFKAPLDEVLAHADELKVVIYHPSDFEWAEKHAQKVKPGCLLYLQPEWDRSEKMTGLIVDYIKDHPEWRLSLQIHKYIHVP